MKKSKKIIFVVLAIILSLVIILSASDTVTKWIEHSMLPDDITIMNIRF